MNLAKLFCFIITGKNSSTRELPVLSAIELTETVVTYYDTSDGMLSASIEYPVVGFTSQTCI